MSDDPDVIVTEQDRADARASVRKTSRGSTVGGITLVAVMSVAAATIDAAILENVRRAVAGLSAVPLLADLVAKNKLMIVGAEYRLKTGRVDLIKP